MLGQARRALSSQRIDRIVAAEFIFPKPTAKTSREAATLAFSVQTPVCLGILVLMSSSAYESYCSLSLKMLLARLVNKQEPLSSLLIGLCWVMSATMKSIYALTRFDYGGTV